jgi:hypothetical protein
MSVLVCYTEPVFTKRQFFFILQYIQPYLSKNPKYTFYIYKQQEMEIDKLTNDI